MTSLETRLQGLRGNPALTRLNHGIERESLRITPAGALSQRSHPGALGSPLTHPSITTDFCEAQLELITQVHQSAEDCIHELTDIHAFVHQELDSELLWPMSMPCELPSDQAIPIARYGNSNAARFKEVYRKGLAYRYGRAMQTISGIHYNFSISDTLWCALAEIDGETADRSIRDDGYLRLIRNFRRHGWLLIYLFGASPTVCESFLRNKEHTLLKLDERTRYLPNATSLRMGPLGYQIEAQNKYRVIYDSLAEFEISMRPALLQPYHAYKAIEALDRGSCNQLTDALLQVEAEFYATVRAKRKTQSGERALVALRRRGIEYVEVRSLDVDPFEPVGISVSTAKFLDLFLLHSLLVVNNGESKEQSIRNLQNQLRTVHQGRDPNLALMSTEGPRRLIDWAKEILEGCLQVATLIDEMSGGHDHQSIVEYQVQKVQDASLTPAAIMQSRMVDGSQSFAELGLELAHQHHETFHQSKLSERKLHGFREQARQSEEERDSIEAADTMSFDAYLADYLSMRDDA